MSRFLTWMLALLIVVSTVALVMLAVEYRADPSTAQAVQGAVIGCAVLCGLWALLVEMWE